MGVPNSEVGYTSAMPRREDHEVHKDMWGHWGKNNLTITLVHCAWLTGMLRCLYYDHRVHFSRHEKTASICMCNVNSLVFMKKTELYSLRERNWACKYYLLFMCVHCNCSCLQLLSEFHHSQIIFFGTYVYWTVHHLDSWVKRDQLDVTCFISLLNAQHVSDVNT